jgi:hypothetical protein
MPLIASASSGADFAPAPSGLQSAVCSAVFDMGEEWSEMYKKLNQKVCIFWELAEKMSDGRPYMLSKQYTVSLGDKANLRRDLESWRGKPFTTDELAGFDLEKLVGVNATLNVMHVPGKKDGKIRAQIAGVMPAMKGAVRMAITSTEVPKWAHEQKNKNNAGAAAHKAEAATTPDEDGHAEAAPTRPAAYADPALDPNAPPF